MSRSGAQARLAGRRGRAGAEASARSPKRKWPLRKVVGDAWEEILHGHEIRRDLLECGHTVGQASDMIGDTYPARRRCRECAATAQTADTEG